MEKYSKVYILSFPFDILRCRRYFCELSLCELNISACLSVECLKQLSSALSTDHAFEHHSEFGATIAKMSLNFGVYINRRYFFSFNFTEWNFWNNGLISLLTHSYRDWATCFKVSHLSSVFSHSERVWALCFQGWKYLTVVK